MHGLVKANYSISMWFKAISLKNVILRGQHIENTYQSNFTVYSTAIIVRYLAIAVGFQVFAETNAIEIR